MSGQHTPGPWELDGIAIAGSDHRMGDVCLMGDPAQYAGDTADMCDNWEANARLISAAPDLLEALRACAKWMETTRASGDAGFWDWHEGDEYSRAMAAIAKATGGAA